MFIKNLVSKRGIERKGCHMALGASNHDCSDRAQSTEQRVIVDHLKPSEEIEIGMASLKDLLKKSY